MFWKFSECSGYVVEVFLSFKNDRVPRQLDWIVALLDSNPGVMNDCWIVGYTVILYEIFYECIMYIYNIIFIIYIYIILFIYVCSMCLLLCVACIVNSCFFTSSTMLVLTWRRKSAARQGHAVVLQRANGYGLPRGHVSLTCLVLRRADLFSDSLWQCLKRSNA